MKNIKNNDFRNIFPIFQDLDAALENRDAIHRQVKKYYFSYEPGISEFPASPGLRSCRNNWRNRGWGRIAGRIGGEGGAGWGGGGGGEGAARSFDRGQDAVAGQQKITNYLLFLSLLRKIPCSFYWTSICLGNTRLSE